jgi:hypothetical protein
MARTPVTSPNPYTFAGLADNNSLAAVDSNWFNQNGVDGHVSINGEKFNSNYAQPSDVCWQGSGSFTADQYCTVKLTVSSNDTDSGVGVSVRNNGAGQSTMTMYRAYYIDEIGGGVNGKVYVQKVTTGNSVSNLTTINENFVTNDLLTLEVFTSGSDAVLRVWRNSTQLGSDITDSSSPLTSGKIGLHARGGTQDIYGDDVVGGSGVADAGVVLTRVERGRTVLRGLNRGFF